MTRSTQHSAINTFLLLFLLVACQPVAPTPTPAPQSAWGSVVTLAHAEQTDAPALAVDANGIVAAWVGADEKGVFQALRTLNATAITDPVRLPLPVRPYAQQFAPASANRQHLFWLDSNVEGETRLFTALLKPNLDRDRELTILTRESTRRYILLPVAEGGVWAVASAGLASEPNLVAHYVDGDGRWRLSEADQITTFADWPTSLQRADGTWTLFWLRTTDFAVMQAGFIDGQLNNSRPILEGVQLNAADRLDGFYAAQDSTHTYLFWNVTRGGIRHETWFTSTGDLSTWPPPTRLQITPAATTGESGFNAGVVLNATVGDRPIAWVKPASGRFAVLPVAAQVDDQLALIYLRAGQIIGYTPMNITADLIGVPNLVVDRDLYLYLAWSQPDPAGYANLQLTSLKFALWPWTYSPPAH